MGLIENYQNKEDEIVYLARLERQVKSRERVRRDETPLQVILDEAVEIYDDFLPKVYEKLD